MRHCQESTDTPIVSKVETIQRNQKLKCNLKSHGDAKFVSRMKTWALFKQTTRKIPTEHIPGFVSNKVHQVRYNAKNVYLTFQNSINRQIEMKNLTAHVQHLSESIYYSTQLTLVSLHLQAFGPTSEVIEKYSQNLKCAIHYLPILGTFRWFYTFWWLCSRFADVKRSVFCTSGATTCSAYFVAQKYPRHILHYFLPLIYFSTPGAITNTVNSRATSI